MKGILSVKGIQDVLDFSDCIPLSGSPTVSPCNIDSEIVSEIHNNDHSTVLSPFSRQEEDKVVNEIRNYNHVYYF